LLSSRRTQSEGRGRVYSRCFAFIRSHSDTEDRLTGPVGGIRFGDEKFDSDVDVCGPFREERVGRAVSRRFEALPHHTLRRDEGGVPAAQSFFEVPLYERDLDAVELLPQRAGKGCSPFREVLEDFGVESSVALCGDISGREWVEVGVVLRLQLATGPDTPPRVVVGEGWKASRGSGF